MHPTEATPKVLLRSSKSLSGRKNRFTENERALAITIKTDEDLPKYSSLVFNMQQYFQTPNLSYSNKIIKFPTFLFQSGKTIGT